jgi:hypothetical protein
MKRDFQRQKVYDWEAKYIEPQDKSKVDFESAQKIVDYVWAQEGLSYSPKVVELPKQTKRACAKANRTRVLLPREGTVSTATLLHELAHSMTMTHDDEGDRHGEKFAGIYMQLLDRYLKIPLVVSMHTAAKMKVKYDTTAKPVFLDEIN